MGRVWVLPYRPERFQELAKTSISHTLNLTAQWSTTVDLVTMTGDQITAVNGIGHARGYRLQWHGRSRASRGHRLF